MAVEPWHYAHDGLPLVGELYRPDRLPNGRAVLVVHEADGIGGNVRRHCAILAELGYLAAAADLHGGGRVLDDAEIPGALQAFRDDPILLRRRVGASLDALVSLSGIAPESIAAIGYCFGGTAVLELARSGAAVAAVASFHGLLTTSLPARAHGIQARILACTGALDPLVPLNDVTAFQLEMDAAAADWQLLVHGRALHSFTNADVDRLGDSRMGYDPAAASLSWAALLNHLQTTFS
jgi:dienelactone hydrolase